MRYDDEKTDSGLSRHAVATYAPGRVREGLALCLSGGGYRASLFHLGALRRLNELGILSGVDEVSSVSGGSILAAHLATRLRPWPSPGEVAGDWDARVAAPFREFVSRNLRTRAILNRLLPWNWFRTSTGVMSLMQGYERRLSGLRLGELPERPIFVLCATDMTFGVNWVFERNRVGDYQVGYVSPVPDDWSLARAIAASSCFPPVFNPMPVGLTASRFRGGEARGESRDEAISDLRLTDGGVYDNLGLEPVWKNRSVLLVSDGGATLDFESDKGLFWRLRRYTAIIQDQVGDLRKRWLISNFLSGELSGAYWGVGSSVDKYDLLEFPRYSGALVNEVVSEVRTDLDAFSEAETAVLENHGYTLAAAAIAKHQPRLPSIDPAPVPVVPHPDWLDEDRVRRALANSHKRRLLGRNG